MRCKLLAATIIACLHGGAFALAPPAEETPEPVLPAFGVRLEPRRGLAPESTADGATVYLNESGPFAGSPPLGTDPRMIGEAITLAPNEPAPLEVRSVEFGVVVQATTPLWVTIRIWDSYNSAATPVNAGLLRSETFDFGTVAANAPGQFYPGLKVAFASPVPLSDPNVFVEFQFRTSPGGPFAPVQQVFAMAPSGPTVGSSPNDFFRDLAPGDGMFSPVERRQFNAASCSPNPPGCQANMLVHLRGAPNPDVIDPGIDLFETPGGGATVLDLAANPLPAGLFDSCATPGQVSDPLASSVTLEGVPLVTSPPNRLGSADTVIRRTSTASVPAPGSQAVIPIEIAALSLEGSAPVTVTYNGGLNAELWLVKAALSDGAQTPGTMTITRGLCAGEGGTFAATLPVRPKLIFTRVSDACRIVLDTGGAPSPALLLATTEGHWVPEPSPGLALVEDPIGGAGVDGNGDGTLDAAPLPPTSNFHPGVRAARCGCCQSAGPACGIEGSPGTCLAAGGVFLHGGACAASSGQCEAACAPTAVLEMRMTVFAGGGGSIAVIPAAEGTADVDGDAVPDRADNCAAPGTAATPNPLQQDTDGDGAGDACDTCPLLCDLAQADVDGDGAGDPCDCAPANPALKASPGPIGGLSILRATVAGDLAASWPDIAPTAGSATTYDLARGSLSALASAGYPGGAACASAAQSAPAYVEGAAQCAATAGQGCWYFVRGGNGCGLGSWSEPGQPVPHPLDGPASPCP